MGVCQQDEGAEREEPGGPEVPEEVPGGSAGPCPIEPPKRISLWDMTTQACWQVPGHVL